MSSDQLSNSEIHLPTRRRKRHRPPNWAPRKSISELIAERDFAAALAAVDPTPLNRDADRAACAALAEARWAKAVEFGVPHGWAPSARGFRIEDLCGFHNSKRRYREVRAPSLMFDHAGFFRWEKGAARRGPAGVVSHPYKPAFNLAEAEAFAAENELTVYLADAFQSWWDPDKCLTVVWERAGPGTGGARRGGCWKKPQP